MGYFLTTEHENAVPPKSWGMPKTHVPGPSVKERGLRYYQPESGRWVNRDPLGDESFLRARYKEIRREDRRRIKQQSQEPPYLFTQNSPAVLIDPIGLNVINNSDLSAWVYSSGAAGWQVIAPGATITGDTDGVCPNAAGGITLSGLSCLKIIDCFDATITGSSPGPYAITPSYAGATAGRGNTPARKCCCALAPCAYALQAAIGGAINPLSAFGSKPPGYP